MYLSFILHMLLLLHIKFVQVHIPWGVLFQVINFTIFLTITKNPKLSTNKVGVPVIILPPPQDGMLVHHKVPPNISSGFLDNMLILINIPRWREAQRQWSVLPRNTTQRPHQVMSLPINPSHPHINMHILHAVLYTFSKVLIRRICLTIKRNFSWWSFPLFSWC